MDGDCVFAVPGGTVTAYAAGTLLPAIHSLTFFQEAEIWPGSDLNSRCSDIGELIAQYDFPVQLVSVLVLVLAVPYENLYGSVQSVFADLRYLK